MRLLKAMHETERFSSTEQNIVDYILAHPAEIADLTTRELAEKTFTSPAAVFRLCQKLGLKGYNEFKLKFISEVNRVAPEGRSIIHRPIKNTDTAEGILRKIAAIEVEAIEETKNELDTDALDRVADRMMHASVIDFYAYDQNADLASMAIYNLLQIGRPAVLHTAMNSQFAQAQYSDKTHLAILISRTGENRRLIRTAQILTERHVPIVLLSISKDAPLARYADEFLYVANTIEYLDFGGTVFSVGVRYIMDVLFSIVLSRDEAHIEKNYDDFEGYLGRLNAKDRLW
ncbi:MurR/RpiR family transcriptional regulator [uncultured Selenomonas sp.]|uniref:MurR/RpiR family transcriptional regulator n=1 Tax=uncultured Selenomonas sp. TaxID=159275 RepID=UPI0025D3CBB3|nr:MurR/RpiR family transcriptional regulator [uncultured Selenomonas sp.]